MKPVTSPGGDYATAIETYRRGRLDFLKRHPESPIPPAQRMRFQAPPWYPVDAKYRVVGKLERNVPPPVARFPASGGDTREYLDVGLLAFTLDGTPLALHAYRDAQWEENELFVPFMDATTGRETYGGGRYLEVEWTGAGEPVLDFNKAYNPFCAYNDEWSCTIPPEANALTVAVRAGEKGPVEG